MANRKQPNLREQLAAALLQLSGCPITYQEARELTAKQIIARHQLHHWTYVAVLGGSNHPTNMSWMATAAHRARTTKIDIPAIAKLKRHGRKRKGPSMPGSKDSPFKKRMDGTTERRR